MVLIIPALQILNGRCSMIVEGEQGTGSFYTKLSDNPAELCKLFRKENAKALHLTDNDFNFSQNNSALDTIINISKSVDIPLQVEANFKSVNECRYLLDKGIYRTIVGELVFLEPDGVKGLLAEYTSARIVGLVEASSGIIKYNSMSKNYNIIELIEYMKNLGFGRILLKEKNWLKDGNSVDFDELKKIGGNGDVRITLYDGINNAIQLWELNKLFRYGIDSLVIGKPLYENNFPCQSIWRMAEAESR